MAVLAKIRQRSALMIAVIALALFAFLLPDLFTKGFNRTSNNVGSINGKDISFEEFRIRVDAAERNNQGSGMTSMQIVNGVWDQEVKRVLLEAEYAKLGLRIGRDQLMDVMIQNPNIGQNSMFLNEDKVFDKAKFNEYIASVKNAGIGQWNEWLAFERQLEQMGIEQMYYTMIKSGFVTTSNEGKFSYELDNNKVDFDFVPVLFSTIKNEDVKVTDAEIIAYIKKNEKKYKTEANTDLEYVLIESKPSKEDEEEVKALITSLLDSKIVYNEKTGKKDTLLGFRKTTNLQEFVDSNSDIKYDSTFVAKKDLPSEYADQLFNLAKGEIYGPYKFNDYYAISKLEERRSGANVKASHILLAYKGSQKANPSVTRTNEEARAKAEELLKQINANPSSFEEFARVNSDDSSSQSGGDLGYFGPNMMVKPFNDYVFSNPVGKVGLVETDFGYHIIKVTEKQDGVRLATIAQRIEASDATNDKNYTTATKFEMEAESKKDFGAVAKELNLTVVPVNNILAFDETIQGLGNQRAIVRWAFNSDTSEGDVKKFDLPAGHVIVKVKKRNEAGLMSVNAARVGIESILRNNKKAELIKAKMKGATLEEVAKNANTTIYQANGIALTTPFLPNIGSEPKVVGVAFATKQGKTSDLIEGNLGVYKIKTRLVVKAFVLPNYINYSSKIQAQNQRSVTGRIFPALKDNARIKDNRAEFNY